MDLPRRLSLHPGSGGSPAASVSQGLEHHLHGLNLVKTKKLSRPHIISARAERARKPPDRPAPRRAADGGLRAAVRHDGGDGEPRRPRAAATRRSCSSGTSSCWCSCCPGWCAPAAARSRRGTSLGHVVRGLAGVAAVACYFYAIAHLRLADAVLLNQSMPLFIPLVERAWVGERIPGRLWGVLLLGFAGLLLILRPGYSASSVPAAVVGLASAVFASIAQVGIRRLTRTEPVTADHLLLRARGFAGRAAAGRLLVDAAVGAHLGDPAPDGRLRHGRPVHAHARVRPRARRARGAVPLRGARLRRACSTG